jgi:DNA-binding response OmpR family regulator
MQVFAYEPDQLEREFLNVLLRHEGYRAEIFQAEESVLARCRKEPTAWVMVSLQDQNRGLTLCKRVREVSESPLIALTNRHDEELSATLYECGVDEVIARPIRPRLFTARLENLRRRALSPAARAETEDKLVVGPLQLFPARLELRKGDQSIPLTPLQCKILYHLMLNAGQIMPRTLLEDKVWGYDGEVLSNAIKTHICHLRQKVEDDPLSPRYIQTVKGVGYRLEKPVLA